MKYQNFISSFVRFVSLYKSPKRRNGFHFFVSSFCRVSQGAKTNKRQNAKTTFHFFVCSFCRVVQVAKAKKWNFISSFLRFIALVKAPKRTNDRTQKQNFNSSFVRFVALYKSQKRRNGISFLRFLVLSPSSKHDGTTKWPRNIKVWFLVVTCSFCRLFVLSTSTRRQNDRTTTRKNKVLRPFRFVALYKSPKRRN